MCLEFGSRGIWKYPFARSIELKILVLLLILLSISSKAGTGKHSSTVRSFNALKSTTGLNEPSDLGTSSNGLDHSDLLGVIIPASNIPVISASRTFLLLWGILYAGKRMGLAPGVNLISCCSTAVSPIGLDFEGKIPGNAVNSFFSANFPCEK